MSANNLKDFFQDFSPFIDRHRYAHAQSACTPPKSSRHQSFSVYPSLCWARFLQRALPTATMPQALDAKSPITYFIADGSGKPGYHSSDRELARWALQAWQRSAANGFRFAAATESSALIRLYWAGPDSGEYGETRPIVVGGQQGAAVFIRPDIDSLGPGHCAARQGRRAPARQHRLFDVRARTRPRAGTRAHAGFPRHHVLLRVWRRRCRILRPVSRPDSHEKRHRGGLRAFRRRRESHSSNIWPGMNHRGRDSLKVWVSRPAIAGSSAKNSAPVGQGHSSRVGKFRTVSCRIAADDDLISHLSGNPDSSLAGAASRGLRPRSPSSPYCPCRPSHRGRNKREDSPIQFL